MDWRIAIGAAVVVGVLGAVIAVLWWRLTHRHIPYDDEKYGAPKSGKHHDVVIIREDKHK